MLVVCVAPQNLILKGFTCVVSRFAVRMQVSNTKAMLHMQQHNTTSSAVPSPYAHIDWNELMYEHLLKK